MTERKIRQADLAALESNLKLYINEEMQKRDDRAREARRNLLIVLTPPIIGATVELLRMLKGILEKLQ